MLKVSIIMPTLNEADGIEAVLCQLQPLRQCGYEVIVADGGSEDKTVVLAEPYVDRIVRTATGRAKQMNGGAAVACGDLFWFLHADTRMASDARPWVREALSSELSDIDNDVWGRFDLRLTGRHWFFRVIETLINIRSRWSGIATGDQGIFMTRKLFEKTGGFLEIPIMEDVEISSRLKRIAAPICLKTKLTTSSRRWEDRGVIRTILLMWYLRLRFYLGVDPASLAERYR